MSHFGSVGQSAASWHCTPFAAVAVLVIALIATGCAQQLPQHEASAAAIGKAQPASCQAEQSGLVSQPEPDCEFRAVRQGTVDTDEFARLKLAYGRQCYQRAERAARRQLQEVRASRACEARPFPLASR